MQECIRIESAGFGQQESANLLLQKPESSVHADLRKRSVTEIKVALP